MKFFSYLTTFLLIINCTGNKGVYWCGDHPCVNKVERESYFKKTMIVEIKNIEKNPKKKYSKIEKITKQAVLDEKKEIYHEKNLVKQKRIEKKDLEKQAKLERKKRIKEKKELKKKLRLEEKKQISEESEFSKKKIVKNQKKQQDENIKLEANNSNIKIKLTKFNELVEKITKKNMSRPYPDINDTQN